jgi:hypothetical protein
MSGSDLSRNKYVIPAQTSFTLHRRTDFTGDAFRMCFSWPQFLISDFHSRQRRIYMKKTISSQSYSPQSYVFSLMLPLMLALGGCVTSERIDGPDGRDAFLVECTDAEQSWRACYKKAAELCGRDGYYVYDQDRGSRPGRDARKKSMFIGCRNR